MGIPFRKIFGKAALTVGKWLSNTESEQAKPKPKEPVKEEPPKPAA